MASICGVEVKNLKTFRGHEGEPLYQGSIYLNGKRLGYWSQDSWGGCDDYDFNVDILNPVVKKVANTTLVDPDYKDIFDVDCLIDMVIKLKEDEKVYKNFCKKGYPCTLLVTDRYHCFYSATRDKSAVTDKQYAMQYFKKQIDEYASKCFKNGKIKIKIYNRADDFILNF